MISFIFGTFNREALLRDCLTSIVIAVEHAKVKDYEIVVADGGSADGTRELLAGRSDVLLVDGGREGAVKAFNAAFDAAHGEYIVTLNDDCRMYPTALARGKNLLDNDPKIGQVAFGFTRPDQPRIFIEDIASARPYANFGMTRTEVAGKAAHICGGFWAPCYRTYGGDTELSCWVWRLGYRVEPIREAMIHDVLYADGLRQSNHEQGRAQADGRLFWKRWRAPLEMLKPRGTYPDVTPAELERLKEAENG